MKNIFTYMTIVASLLTLTSCVDEPVIGPTPASAERDIYYTVAGETGFAGFSGSTVHIDTDAEWDALLDQFCDYAKNGDNVTFCNTGSTPSKAKGVDKDTPTSIITSDRDELKAWMKDMEKAGKTVNITYDDGTGTWSGRAYANLGSQNDAATEQSYEGVLDFVPVPALDNPPLEGLVMALQTAAGDTYIVTIHGMLLWFEEGSDDLIVRLLNGTPATLIGTASSHNDLNGNAFIALELTVPEDGVIEF